MCMYILIKSFGSTQKTQLILTTTTVFTVFAVFSPVVENTRHCFLSKSYMITRFIRHICLYKSDPDFYCGRTGRDQPKVVQEVLADLKKVSTCPQYLRIDTPQAYG